MTHLKNRNVSTHHDHIQGTGTADVRLQEAHVGPGSDADALAAWKAGDTTDTGYPHPSSLPGALVPGRPILGMLRMVKGCTTRPYS